MWFKKRRVNLIESEVFKGMTDTHLHLLWGVDDGAKDVEHGEQMMCLMQNMGMSSVFTTPHIMAGLPMNDPRTLTLKFEERILPLAKRYGIKARLAGEYMLDEAFLPQLLSGEKLLTYDGQHMLVEMSHIAPPSGLDNMLFEICSSGYIPVLAHPERYSFCRTEEYEMMKERGCKFQLNILSLSDKYGVQVRGKAQVLLDSEMYDFIGTDAHSPMMLSHISNIGVSDKTLTKIKRLVANNNLLNE